MLKILHVLTSLISLFFLSGCFLIDPMSIEPKSGKETIEGEIKEIKIIDSFTNSYNALAIKGKEGFFLFEKNNRFDDRILAQIEIGDYLKYSANYDEKMKIIEITKKRQKNCKINAITQYNQNNKQKFIEFGYVIKNEKDEENCSKFTLKEPSLMIELARKTNYIN